MDEQTKTLKVLESLYLNTDRLINDEQENTLECNAKREALLEVKKLIFNQIEKEWILINNTPQ